MHTAKTIIPVPYSSKGSSTFSKMPPIITPANTNFARSVSISLFHALSICTLSFCFTDISAASN